MLLLLLLLLLLLPLVLEIALHTAVAVAVTLGVAGLSAVPVFTYRAVASFRIWVFRVGYTHSCCSPVKTLYIR